MAHTFEILTCEHKKLSTPPGALRRVFTLCRELVESIRSDIRAGLLPATFCAHSSNYEHPQFVDMQRDLRALIWNYPLELKSPFEQVESISGGIWRASEICGGDDALLKLTFQPGTTDLPLHSHDFSDRVVFVAEGSGTFEFVNESLGSDLTTLEVGYGDALIFAKGTVHSFRTATSNLTLISYHSPFIDLDSPRQYSVYSR